MNHTPPACLDLLCTDLLSSLPSRAAELLSRHRSAHYSHLRFAARSSLYTCACDIRARGRRREASRPNPGLIAFYLTTLLPRACWLRERERDVVPHRAPSSATRRVETRVCQYLSVVLPLIDPRPRAVAGPPQRNRGPDLPYSNLIDAPALRVRRRAISTSRRSLPARMRRGFI